MSAKKYQRGGLAIVVPTFKRPELVRRTLLSLVAQQSEKPPTIIVSDNDPAGSDGVKAAREIAASQGAKDRVHPITVSQQGLSSNRNAALKRAFADPSVQAVALIDDDAEAEEGWYSAIEQVLLDVDDVALVGGPTDYVFSESVPTEIRRVEMFGVPFQEQGFIPRLRSANNCTITRHVFEALNGDVFDTSYNVSSGEDVLLFTLCAQMGLKSYWAPDAIVREAVPDFRATEEWVTMRHRANAANSARIDKQLNGRAAAWPRQLFLAMRESLAGLARLQHPDPAVSLTGRLRLTGARGRLFGLLGGTPTHDTALRRNASTP